MRWRGILALALLISGGAIGGVARADEVTPSTNVGTEPSTPTPAPTSAQLGSRAAGAEMSGNPTYALTLADRAIRADPKDPWPYYDKGMALSQLGEMDAAVAAFFAAEQHFAPYDRQGRGVAVFGRAHALAGVGRCDEARQAFQEYMSLVRGNPDAVAQAQRYSRDCRSPVPPPTSPPSG
jgi:tetratricopeptide (TPR) repeat protein